jgi:acetyl/propionyl-CoA carboxylase alpha subunit
MATFRVVLNGREREIEAFRQGDRLRVAYNGQTVELHLLHTDGSYFVLERKLPDGTCQRIRAAGIGIGDQRQLWVNGRAFTYERVRQQDSSAAADQPNLLSASIPAVVSQLLVEVGDTVAAGDKLILLESMKMIIPIQAPYDGTVTQLHCAAGDSVQPEMRLIEIEAAER